MVKLKTFQVFLVICTLFVLSACTNTKVKTLEEFYTDAKIEQVNQVTIQDGATGEEKTITEQEQVNEFMSLIKDIEFTPQKDQAERVGWNYQITLFDFINETEFTFAMDKIGDTYYDYYPNIVRIVDQYYLDLESNE